MSSSRYCMVVDQLALIVLVFKSISDIKWLPAFSFCPSIISFLFPLDFVTFSKVVWWAQLVHLFMQFIMHKSRVVQNHGSRATTLIRTSFWKNVSLASNEFRYYKIVTLDIFAGHISQRLFNWRANWRLGGLPKSKCTDSLRWGWAQDLNLLAEWMRQADRSSPAMHTYCAHRTRGSQYSLCLALSYLYFR